MIVWITGLPCSGKTTLAYELHKRIALGRAVVLDAEDMRSNLWPEIGYSDQDRRDNMQRLGYLARMFSQLGLVAIVAAVSPFRDTRNTIRACNPGVFFEVYLECPFDARYARDKRGILGPPTWSRDESYYEPPGMPEIHGHTDTESPDALADRVIRAMVEKGLVHAH